MQAPHSRHTQNNVSANCLQSEDVTTNSGAAGLHHSTQHSLLFRVFVSLITLGSPASPAGKTVSDASVSLAPLAREGHLSRVYLTDRLTLARETASDGSASLAD